MSIFSTVCYAICTRFAPNGEARKGDLYCNIAVNLIQTFTFKWSTQAFVDNLALRTKMDSASSSKLENLLMLLVTISGWGADNEPVIVLNEARHSLRSEIPVVAPVIARWQTRRYHKMWQTIYICGAKIFPLILRESARMINRRMARIELSHLRFTNRGFSYIMMSFTSLSEFGSKNPNGNSPFKVA